MMKNLILTFTAASMLLGACSLLQKLHSTTYIKAENTFILGNNEHGKFSADVTNTSNQEITVWQCPIAGGQHSPLVLKSNEHTKLQVEKNTALRIENASSEEVAVKLKVKGDIGLSMGYKH